MTRNAIALALAVVLSGCDAPQSETLRIAVIPKGTTHEFWKSVHAGALKAERALQSAGTDVKIIWQGPLKEDDRDTQIQVVENFTVGRVAAIVLAPLDAHALVRPVEAATRAGIPVVVIDSGLASTAQKSFVATDNYAGGAAAAAFMAEALDGRGDVVLLRYAVGSASTEARERGFLETLADDHPEIRVISDTEYAGATRETAFRTAQALLNRFAAQVDGVFAVNESATIGMTLALREAGLAGGRVVMVGFDTGRQSVADLERGDVQALVVQDPMRRGYDGVVMAVRALRGETVPERIDTGVKLVTAADLDREDIRALVFPPLAEYLDE